MTRNAPRPRLTRRRFINLVGRAGGYAAIYNTMAAMSLLPVPSAYAAHKAVEAIAQRAAARKN
jgi:hypothetical protein